MPWNRGHLGQKVESLRSFSLQNDDIITQLHITLPSLPRAILGSQIDAFLVAHKMHSIGIGYRIHPGYRTQTITPGEGVRSKWGPNAAGLCVPLPQSVAIATTEVAQLHLGFARSGWRARGAVATSPGHGGERLG